MLLRLSVQRRSFPLPLSHNWVRSIGQRCRPDRRGLALGGDLGQVAEDLRQVVGLALVVAAVRWMVGTIGATWS